VNDLPLDAEEQLLRAFQSNQSITVDQVDLGGSVEAPRAATTLPEKPLDEYPLQVLMAAFARAVAKQQGFEGAELQRYTSDFEAEIQSLVLRFQIKATEERQRKETTTELERLLDGIAQTGTPAGRAVAAHRDSIVQAFQGVDLARVADGIQVLVGWLRNPTDDRSAQVQALIASLQTTMGSWAGSSPEPQDQERGEEPRRDVRTSPDQSSRSKDET
jgi:hypothetical protein